MIENKDIWSKVLLKNIEGNKLVNAKTVSLSNKKYQIFEVLIAETFALLYEDFTWTSTEGGHDYGVDVYAVLKSKFASPIFSIDNVLLLGQIKRRKTGYRYDDFLKDSERLFTYYVNEKIFKETSLYECFFVISTESKTNVKNLQNAYKKEISEVKKITYINSIRSPIEIIDAEVFSVLWRFNQNYFINIFKFALSKKQLELLKKYLEQVDTNIDWDLKLENLNDTVIGETTKNRLIIKCSYVDMPLKIKLQWIDYDREIQIITPSCLVNCKDIEITFHSIYNLDIRYRSLKAGNFNLGIVNLYDENYNLLFSYYLGNQNFINALCPIYQIHPSYKFYNSIMYTISKADKLLSFAVTGEAGVGKTTLLENILISFNNSDFFCITITAPHDCYSKGNMIRALLIKSFGQYLRKPILITTLFHAIKDSLFNIYNPDWDDDLYSFINDKHDYRTSVISDILSSILLRFSSKQKTIILIKDMHWIDSESSLIIKNAIGTLKTNKDFISNPIIIIFEGRDHELLEIDYKLIDPIAWNSLLDYCDENLHMSSWSIKDSEEFIDSLLFKSELNDVIIYNDFRSYLIKYSHGNPMHILELIKYFFTLNILHYNSKNEIKIDNIEYLENNSIPLNMVKLIQFRLQFFRNKFSDYLDYIIIYANLDLFCDNKTKTYIVDCIMKNYAFAEQIALEYSFFIIDNKKIIFRHETYFNEIIKMPIINDAIFKKFIGFFKNANNNSNICKLKLLTLKPFYDDEMAADLSLKIMAANKNDRIILLCYNALLNISEETLLNKSISIIEIHYNLGTFFLRTSSYELALYHLNITIELASTNSSKNLEIIAKCFQDISNIYASQLKTDLSIKYINIALNILKNYTHESWDLEIKLYSRLAINYSLIGNINKSMEIFNHIEVMLKKNNNYYLYLRALYERQGLLIHFSPKHASEILCETYNKAKVLQEMQPTEYYFIDAMRIIADIIQYNDDLNKLEQLKSNATIMNSCLENTTSTYIISLNFLSIAYCALKIENDVSQAIYYNLKALSISQEAKRNEMIWKCSINLAQLFDFTSEKEKSLHYAKLAYNIINVCLSENKIDLNYMTNRYYYPLSILNKILKTNTNPQIFTDLFSKSFIPISLSWKSYKIYLLK